VEDILDTGLTLSYLRGLMLQHKPASLKIATCLDKPERRLVPIEADYVCFKIPNQFVIGYGMDYAERYRGVADIRILSGDASGTLSHRYAMLAGFAEGTSRLTNFSTGADPHSSLGCMKAMGAKVELEGKTISVTGTAACCAAEGRSGLRELGLDDADAGGAGGGAAGTYRFVGDESLTVRPMERIRKPLEMMGARIELTDGHAPMTVHGGDVEGD
jgi:hypothetical protein